MYIAGYFMLLFDLTPNRGASEGHRSNPNNSNNKRELKFSKSLPGAITCLLYLEFNNSVRIEYRELSRPTSGGLGTDTVNPEKCKIVSWSISLRSLTAINHAIYQRHHQRRSSHRECFTLTSHSFRTQVLQCLLFRLIR